jgi:geranylgeranyl pyrophosphate synthase
MSIQSWLPLYQNLIESAIRDFFEKRYANTTDIEKKYEEAIRYAVESGGKRIRPILAMIAYEHHTGQDIAYW